MQTKHDIAVAKLSKEQREQRCVQPGCNDKRECHEYGRGLCRVRHNFICNCKRFKGK